MNIEHIESFLYVVHYKSLNKAAKALFLSQPTVTARIKALQNTLQVKLFLRDGNHLTLTGKGKERMWNRKDKQELVSGSNIVTAQYFLPHVLQKWKEKVGNIKFRIISGPSATLKDLLYNRQVDIALMGQVIADGILNEQILQNEVILVRHKDCPPFEAEGKVTVEQLAKQPFVFFECGAFDWKYVKKLFEVAEIEPAVIAYVDNFEVAKSFVKSMHAISFLPYLSVKEELKSGEFVSVPTKHLFHIQQNIYLTYVSLENIYEPFIQLIRETASDFDL